MGINKKEISNATSDQEKFVLLHPQYSFDDIVLTHVVKEQLKDIIFYKNRSLTTARKAETVMSQGNLEHAVRQIMESKLAHDPQIKVTKREVPEEYVREQTGGKVQ